MPEKSILPKFCDVLKFLMEDEAVCHVYDPKVERADAIAEFATHGKKL